MKKFTYIFSAILLLFLLTTSKSFSQDKSIGTVIKGIVTEKSSGTGMESAAIQVFNSVDSSLTGGILSDKSGKFVIEGIPEGVYTVKVSFIGYGTAVAKNVKTGKDKKEINLGTIKLESSIETTQEIEVVDEMPLMTMENGKKVYDAKKDLTAQTGSTLELLRNVPSVDVDNDGNVSLRGGGNVKILIDGKPSALLSNGTQILQSIPASLIDKVEVINNPSAKYDAEGISGIINLIMKPGENTGYNGNLKATGGTQDKYNINMGGSVKKGKWSLTGNYTYWNYFLPGTTNLLRQNFTSTEARTIDQTVNWKYKGLSHFGSAGADYDIDKMNTLSFVANFFYYKRTLTSNNNLNFLDPAGNQTSNILTNNDDGRDGTNLDATFTYSKKYEQKGKDLTAFVNYSGRNEDQLVQYNTFNNTSTLSKQEAGNDYRFDFLNAQADYTHPFGEESKLEAGLKSNARFINGNYYFRYLDNNTNTWMTMAERDNDADYKDVISAAYGTYSGKYKDFSYQGGLRSEYTYVNFSIQQGTQKYNNNYIDFFPSLMLSQKIGIENTIQLTYSRRINRPGLQSLNPFVRQFDEYTKQTGDPYLKPEYINSAELGYTRSLSFVTLTLTGFYRNVNNSINFVNLVDSNGVSLIKPENAGTSNTAGAEFIAQGGFAKWWTYNGSLSYYNTNLFNNTGINIFDKTYSAWTGRISTTANIPDLVDVQLSYFYNGRQETSQGSIDPMQMMNLSIQKSFFEKKLILGFRVNDLLNTQKFAVALAGSDFSTALRQKSNSRAAFFTVTFNFGEQGSTKSQRTQQRKLRESENEIQQSGN
ncbi:MAG: TonB-dependent receptor [Ignavibacteriae bacterium]|nr:TonB-dependent receptor [Ignavibacteriota bacterium]